jgi:hypothetical protein
MKITRVVHETGSGGFWILPFVAFSWVEGKYYVWLGWLYWMIGIYINDSEECDV